jgi:mycoredoxin
VLEAFKSIMEVPYDMSNRPLKIYTTTSCGDCRMTKAVLDRAGVDYEEIDLDREPDAVATVLAINGGYTTVPTILFPSGQVLVEPSRQQLLEALDLEHLCHAS